MQRYHQTGINHDPNLTSRMPRLSSNSRRTGYIEKLRRNEIIMGNREVNYPHMLPQEQPPKHLSLSCKAHVKIDGNVHITATMNDINS